MHVENALSQPTLLSSIFIYDITQPYVANNKTPYCIIIIMGVQMGTIVELAYIVINGTEYC